MVKINRIHIWNMFLITHKSKVIYLFFLKRKQVTSAFYNGQKSCNGIHENIQYNSW